MVMRAHTRGQRVELATWSWSTWKSTPGPGHGIDPPRRETQRPALRHAWPVTQQHLHAVRLGHVGLDCGLLLGALRLSLALGTARAFAVALALHRAVERAADEQRRDDDGRERDCRHDGYWCADRHGNWTALATLASGPLASGWRARRVHLLRHRVALLLRDGVALLCVRLDGLIVVRHQRGAVNGRRRGTSGEHLDRWMGFWIAGWASARTGFGGPTVFGADVGATATFNSPDASRCGAGV
jgi:hypothetical protein